MTPPLPDIKIPVDLLPADGRFGCGPSKVRPEAVEALAAAGRDYLGTSTARRGCSSRSGALRNGLAELFALPDGYEVLLGNGGTTSFWDAASFGLIDRRSQHLRFGEFSSKFAEVAAAAPHLEEPSNLFAEPGTHPLPVADPDVDTYCLTHNETSTGVAMPLERPARRRRPRARRRHLGGRRPALRSERGRRLLLRPAEVPGVRRRAVAGGRSPAAVERIERIAASDRWVPASLDLGIALENSRKDQTYNTPALATIFLADQQVEWINQQGGLQWAASRCDRSADAIYGWAEASTTPPRSWPNPAQRSHVVATIDFDAAVATPRVSGGAARQRDRRHRELPQARPQPAAHRAVPGDRPRRRRGAHALHRPRGGGDGRA